jgi:predicted XRE-type DNA-binding protein
MSKPESYRSVWDAIADTPEQAANLRARAELMQKIAARLKQHDWTQAEAASRCGVTQPRINDLLRGRVSRFSLDALVNIATALGCRVRFDLEAARATFLSGSAWPALPRFTGSSRVPGDPLGVQSRTMSPHPGMA